MWTVTPRAAAGSGACRPAARGRRARPPAGRARDTGSPSSFTPPWAIVRRASEREPPNSRRDQLRKVHAPLARARGLLDLLRQLARHEHALEAAAAASAASAPWKRSTSARASACLASRGETSAGGSEPSSRSYHWRQRRIRDDSVLPYIWSGGSVIPMWLPTDLDIFCTPSVPGSSGIVSTDCGGWPYAVWIARPISRLNVWSVPPSSTSALIATES